MADKTATQNLTRPQGTDSQRDHWLWLKTLAVEADQRMTSHWYDVDRATNPPLCVVRLTTPRSFDLALSPRITFDTVEQDVGGMADPTGNGILLNQTGYWDVGFYVECNGLGAGVSAEIEARMDTPQGQVGDNRADAALGFVPISMADTIRSATPATNTLTLSMTYSGTAGSQGSVTQVTYAELWAFKIRDL